MSTEVESAPATVTSSGPLAVERIHQGDCIDWLRKIGSDTIDLAFADPPFNIGYEYDEYHDRQDSEAYIAWSRTWIGELHRVLKPGGTFWLAIGDEYAAELKVTAQHQVGFYTRSWVVWYYTFGVNCKQKFSRSHVHLFHFVKDDDDFTFNAEDPRVRVPSARALVYADKRANPIGRLPDDTWIVRPAADDSWVLRPQDLPDGFQPTDDTWYYARVAGTFKERQGFHGCQMPEQLLGRIIRVSSNPGDIVLDPFAGSGTTLAVAKKLGRRWVGCELSAEYARAANERLESIRAGDPLDGPADPTASAPSTANGRRLSSFDAPLPSETIRPPAEAGPGEVELATAAVDAPGPAAIADGDVAAAVASSEPRPSMRRELREVLRDALTSAFFASHDGYSTDWLLANPDLQRAFHEACRDAGLIGSSADWNRELLRLRKQGAVPKRGELKKVAIHADEMDECQAAAEIAWRLARNKFGGASLDEIFCDPAKADFFDRRAKRVSAVHPAAHYRWAGLRLRKASKQLVDDVKRFHFIFATRDFGAYQAWRRANPGRLAGEPGIYLLRGADKQPLFIGKTSDLGRRLQQHAESKMVSDSVTQVSLITRLELPGEEYHDALKEDLVRRHRPRWNVNLVGLAAGGTQ